MQLSLVERVLRERGEGIDDQEVLAVQLGRGHQLLQEIGTVPGLSRCRGYTGKILERSLDEVLVDLVLQGVHLVDEVPEGHLGAYIGGGVAVGQDAVQEALAEHAPSGPFSRPR